jgi:hypothetical protein
VGRVGFMSKSMDWMSGSRPEGRYGGMANPTPIVSSTVPDTDRLARLQTSANRWRTLAVALAAGGIGLLAGGMAQPRPAGPTEYEYVSTGDTIYRIDKFGQMEYINVTSGLRTSQGYIAWGKVDIDASRNLDNRP